MDTQILSQESLQEIRQTLAQRRAELLDASQSTQSKIRQGDAMRSGSDSLDKSSDEQGISSQLRFADRERRLIRKIDAVLERIARGEYGECEVCEEPINARRLKARPMTTMCIDCKEDQEEQEARQKTRPGLIDE